MAKYILQLALAAFCHAFATAAESLSAFETMRGFTNVDNAITALQSGEAAQPSCPHMTDNYVMCITLEMSNDKTVFVAHPLIPEGTTLGSLKGTPDYQMGDSLVQSFKDALNCEEAGSYAMATYPWLSQIDFVTPVMATSVVKSFTVENRETMFACGSGPIHEEAMTAGTEALSDVSIWNTYQDPDATMGNQIIYAYSETTVSNEVEFPLFPPNPPGTTPGGFYDIDITPNPDSPLKGTITWTLKDNTGASHIVFPDGSGDRYYLIMDKFIFPPIKSAVIVGENNLNTKVTVPSYEDTQVIDMFRTGLPFPSLIQNNVIVMEVLPGSDLTELGQVIQVEYEFADANTKVDTKGTGDVEIWNTFQESHDTGGLETIYSYRQGSVSDGVEFTLFPPNPPGSPEGGFYDIDITMDPMTSKTGSITWTLKGNQGAGSLKLPFGSFDRYYLVTDQDIESATLVSGANLNPKVSVPFYEDKSDIVDLFMSGLPFPPVLRNNVILLEVQPGGDMTELGQVMEVQFTVF